jgi:hypothetical protein
LRLVKIGVWSEIAAAATSVSRQTKALAPAVEFGATARRPPPVARTAVAAPMKTSSAAHPAERQVFKPVN